MENLLGAALLAQLCASHVTHFMACKEFGSQTSELSELMSLLSPFLESLGHGGRKKIQV